jgi:hypothetical protein
MPMLSVTVAVCAWAQPGVSSGARLDEAVLRGVTWLKQARDSFGGRDSFGARDSAGPQVILALTLLQVRPPRPARHAEHGRAAPDDLHQHLLYTSISFTQELHASLRQSMTNGRSCTRSIHDQQPIQ